MVLVVLDIRRLGIPQRLSDSSEAHARKKQLQKIERVHIIYEKKVSPFGLVTGSHGLSNT